MKLRSLFKPPGYSWERFGGDLSGGVVAALIALPYGLAMASLMGLPPVLGIFTSILTSPVTSLLGRNPVLIGGTGSVTVPFVVQAVREQGIGGAAKISVVAAVILMAFCVLRLGRHIARVPHPVVTGFSCGIGAMMAISQLDTILGVAGVSASGSALQQLAGILGNLGSAHWAPAVTGVCVVTAATASARWIPRAPAPLLGILAALAVANVLGFHGREIGSLGSGWPSFVGFAWSPRDVFTVVPSGFVLAFVVAVNILITSRVVEHFRGRHRRSKIADADAELGAYGIANICSGMFGAPLSVGIPARSLAVVRCGGTTSVANIFHALLLIAMLRYGNNLISHIPVAALAGVTAWMGLCLLDWSAWRRLQKMNRLDAGAFLGTAVSVVAFNAVIAIAIGCSFYGARALYQRFFAVSEQIPDLQVHG